MASSDGPAGRYLRRGSHGPAVVHARLRLTDLGFLDLRESLPGRRGDGRDDEFDDGLDRAVRQFQQERGVIVDGIVGPVTAGLLDEARWVLGDRLLGYDPAQPQVGDDVLALQRRLTELGFDVGRVDGVFGPRTQRGLTEFQRNTGLPADGTAGPGTFQALSRLRPIVTGGQASALRETERVRRAGPRLPGKVVVVDAGHGGPDTGCRGPSATEHEVVRDLADRVQDRLTATGVLALSTRGRLAAASGLAVDGVLDEATRAAYANDAGAHLLLSLHCDANSSPDASGVATYYYGHDRHGASSAVGEAFAGLLQRELLARTPLRDCRSHPKTWDLLRYTQMPAVRLELGYLTSPHDAVLLTDPDFLDVVAEAVVVSVQRVYLAREDDATTGALRLRDLADRSPASRR